MNTVGTKLVGGGKNKAFLIAAALSLLIVLSLFLSACGSASKLDLNACTTPNAPDGLIATGADGQVTVTWNGVSGVSSYNVYWSTNLSSATALASMTRIDGIAASPYAHTGRTNDTAYYYRVTSVSGNCESAASSLVNATPSATNATTGGGTSTGVTTGASTDTGTGTGTSTGTSTGVAATAPAAPANVVAAAADGQVTLSWDAVSDATSYTIYVGTTTGVTTSNALVSTSTTATSFAQTGLTNGTAYYFIVTASNGAGESAASSEASATPVAAATVPAAPTGVAATAGDGQATINWTAVTGATSYTVYYGTSAGVTKANAAGSSTSTVASLTKTGLTNGTTYYFIVTATNAVGESAVSSEVSATPVAAPPAPAGVSATAGDGQATITWTAVTGATSYKVYYGTSAGVTTAAANSATAATAAATITGLANGTTYYFIVTALNGVGESTASAEVNASPSAPSSTSAVLFSDNFDGGNFNNWYLNPLSGAAFGVVNGELQQTNTAPNIQYHALYYPNGYAWTDYSFALTTRHISNYYAVTSINIYFRVQNGQYGPGNTPVGYCVQLQPGYGGLYKYTTTGASLIQALSPDVTYPNYTGYNVRIDAVGSSIKVTIDGTVRVNTTDTTFASGTIALASVHHVAGFDNIMVTQPMATPKMYYAKGVASPWGIYSANLDGTGETLLASVASASTFVSGRYSPTSRKLCFASDAGVQTMNADGTGLTTIPNTAADMGGGNYAACSPDGAKVVYAGAGGISTNMKMNLINIDGTGKSLWNDGSATSQHQLYPSWNSAGSIYFGISNFGNAYSQQAYLKSPTATSATAPTTLTAACTQFVDDYVAGTIMVYGSCNFGANGLWVADKTNGTGATQLTLAGTATEGRFQQSSGVIFYLSGGNIWKINADNTGNTQLTTAGGIVDLYGVD